MEKKNRMSNWLKYTILGVGVLVVGLVLLLSLVFVVKDVEVNLLKTSNSLSNEQIESIVSETNVAPMGQSVFFFDRDKATEKIEKAVPNIKVINLEVLFPNVISINCEERIPVFAVRLNNSTFNYAVIDDELKVLDTLSANNEYINLTFKQDVEDMTFDDLQKGDKVIVESANLLKSFFTTLKEFSLTESVLLNTFTDIEVYNRHSQNQSYISLKFYTKVGYTIEMYNISQEVDKKVNILVNIISNDNISDDQIIS
ncbi:MAG: FtsQ-type POTRA domain-containing protein [Clostridia bacterium]|nr:FtsQ-type POTRA domain-containing protein [Clostridia bacterium]